MKGNQYRKAYRLTITLQSLCYKVIPSTSIKNALTIKLGGKTIRYDHVGQTKHIVYDQPSSEDQEKHQKTRGIIKIYEMKGTKKEIILAVGAFEADQFVRNAEREKIIHKNIGVCTISLKVFCHALPTEIEFQENFGALSPEHSQKRKQNFKSAGEKIKTAERHANYNVIQSHYFSNTHQRKKNVSNKNSTKKVRKVQSDSIKKKSNKPSQKLSKFMYQIEGSQSEDVDPGFEEQAEFCDKKLKNFQSQAIEQEQKNELEVIGGQLIQERRKNQLYQQKIQTLINKNRSFKQKCSKYENLLLNTRKEYESFIKSLQQDKKGQYIFEINEKKSTLTFSFKKSQNFEKKFLSFLLFIKQQVQKAYPKNYEFENQRFHENNKENRNLLSNIQHKQKQLTLLKKIKDLELNVQTQKKKLKTMEQLTKKKELHIIDLESTIEKIGKEKWQQTRKAKQYECKVKQLTKQIKEKDKNIASLKQKVHSKYTNKKRQKDKTQEDKFHITSFHLE